MWGVGSPRVALGVRVGGFGVGEGPSVGVSVGGRGVRVGVAVGRGVGVFVGAGLGCGRGLFFASSSAGYEQPCAEQG